MNIRCRLGLHDWTKDCNRCANCGKDRFGEHKWRGCRCSACGLTRNKDHIWEGCKCSICGAKRDRQHVWSDKSCSICGAPSPNEWAANMLSSHNYTALIDAVIQLRHPEEDESLTEYSNSSAYLRKDSARMLLAQGGYPAAEAIMKRFTGSSYFDGCSDMAEILVAIGDTKAVPLLKPLYDRGDFRPFVTLNEHIKRFIENFLLDKTTWDGTYEQAWTRLNNTSPWWLNRNKIYANQTGSSITPMLAAKNRFGYLNLKKELFRDCLMSLPILKPMKEIIGSVRVENIDPLNMVGEFEHTLDKTNSYLATLAFIGDAICWKSSGISGYIIRIGECCWQHLVPILSYDTSLPININQFNWHLKRILGHDPE